MRRKRFGRMSGVGRGIHRGLLRFRHGGRTCDYVSDVNPRAGNGIHGGSQGFHHFFFVHTVFGEIFRNDIIIVFLRITDGFHDNVAAVYFFLKNYNRCALASAVFVALGSFFCQIRIVKIVQHIRRPGHVGALLHGTVGTAVSPCVPVGDVLHGVRVHQGAVAHLLEARQLHHGAAHPVARLGHDVGLQLLACPHPVNILRQPRVNAVLVLLNSGVLGRCMYRRVIVHSCLIYNAACLCRKARHLTPRSTSGVQLRAARHASGSPLWGSCRRSRRRGLIPG